MRPLHIIISAALFFTALVSAQKVTVDSSASTDKGKASSSDGDLILDGNDISILPAENKKTVIPASAPAAKTAAVPSPTVTPAAGQTAPQATGSQVQSPAQKVTDEELILEGGAEDLLSKEKALRLKTALPVKEVRPLFPDSSAASGQTQTTPSIPSPGVFADSAVHSAVPTTGNPSPAASVEDARSINFARNLKEYRSPKLAMLMSLILPGSGQVYAKSNIQAAVFGVIEVAVASTGFALSSKATTIKKQARDFADHHYDAARFMSYLDNLKQFLPTITPTTGKADSIYNKVIFVTGEDTTFFLDANARNDDFYGYLDRGGSSPFIRGWDDVKPPFIASGFDIQGSDGAVFSICGGDTAYRVFLNSDSSHTMYGMSANQEHYSGMLRDSRRWAGYSRNTFLTLLINHVASCIMAGIAAKRHNDELLGREGLWQRIDLEQRYVFTGTETAPGYSLQVEF
jgi:hypothetical protein